MALKIAALKLGLVINPLAGIGGPLALKGSDGDAIVEQALRCGAECKANQRAQVMLQQLQAFREKIQWFSAPGVMGADSLEASGFTTTIVGELQQQQTCAEDTQRFVRALVNQNIDLLLFVGGDGTARNIVDALNSETKETKQLVLGVPAGVKMHSGVYAVSPQAAARLVMEFIENKPVSIAMQEVRDIDEARLREGQINAKFYGELLTPNDNRYVQQVKQSGAMDDSAMQAEIAAGIIDEMDNETLYLIGAGTTPKAVMDELALPNTLLGVDVVLGRELLASDVNAPELLSLIEAHPYHPVKVIITATGGQGHIIGRGNQQLSAQLLKHVGKDNLILLITPNKLAALNGRPLMMDSGDIELDRQWSGWVQLVTGYQQVSVYPLSCGEDTGVAE